jgi:hypothetical protein
MRAMMFVGEQPGDRRIWPGKPFVGPAGQVFDDALAAAGIDRAGVYVTNAVKHFKFEQRGKRRIHSKPNAGEIQACRWWYDAGARPDPPGADRRARGHRRPPDARQGRHHHRARAASRTGWRMAARAG